MARGTTSLLDEARTLSGGGNKDGCAVRRWVYTTFAGKARQEVLDLIDCADVSSPAAYKVLAAHYGTDGKLPFSVSSLQYHRAGTCTKHCRP